MVLDRISATVSQFGWPTGLLYLARRALQHLTGDRARLVRYHVVAQPVPPAPAESLRRSPHSRIRQVTASDAAVREFPRPKEVIAQRYRDGATCFVAEIGGRFAGFLWLARDAYEEDEIRCRFDLASKDDCAWDYDVYVEPEFRTGRTFARLWDAANVHLAQQGVRWTLSRISAFNPESLAAHRRLGIRKLHTLNFLCLGPVQIAVLGIAPYFHLSLTSRSRPTLKLRPPSNH